MTAPDNDLPENIQHSTNPFWEAGPLYPPGMYPVKDFVDRYEKRMQLHFKTHKQGNMLYLIGGRMWIRCYTHRRLEPASWLK